MGLSASLLPLYCAAPADVAQACPGDSRDVARQGVHARRGEQFHALDCHSVCQDAQAHPGRPGAVLAQCRPAVEQAPVRAFHVFVLFCAGPVQGLVQLALLLPELEQKCLLRCCDCGLQVLR